MNEITKKEAAGALAHLLWEDSGHMAPGAKWGDLDPAVRHHFTKKADRFIAMTAAATIAMREDAQ